ncbi:MAG TPA: ParB N-terminal domain-containing protein [Myxococcota bacterium]|nr:ParB N-terminal domain-containing protein [Myxococcota bacterium]
MTAPRRTTQAAAAATDTTAVEGGAGTPPSDAPPPEPTALPALEPQLLRVDLIEPNPWNPNRMPARTVAKLRAQLRKHGFLKPIVVRPHPDDPERWQVVDGEHRWRIARDDLGLAAIPCVVVDVDDRHARVLTVNLNELGGEAAPDALAELLHDLAKTAKLEDLETELPYSLRELEDSLALLKVPAGLALDLEEEARAHEAGSPKVLTFVVDEASVVEEAIAQVSEGLEGKNRRGRALVRLARTWLDAQPGPTAADLPPDATPLPPATA